MKQGVFDIITCGSATVDVFAHTQNEQIRITLEGQTHELLAYPSGGKILIEHMHTLTGGGGTNTAVAFSRLGFKTGYIGSLGKDANAQVVLDVLADEKVTFLGSQAQKPTGYSIILDAIGHDRTILTHKGANDFLSLKTVPKTKAYYFSSMMQDSLSVQKKLAKKHTGFLAFNPSMYQVKLGVPQIQEILTKTTLLVFNREEAFALIGTYPDRELFTRLHNLGPKYVVVTNSSNPTVASDGKHMYYLKPKPVPVIEATGAGDAFASALSAGLLKGLPFTQALVWGQLNSESVLGHVGAKKGLLTLAQLKKHMHHVQIDTV